MKYYIILSIGLASLSLVLFALVEILQVPVLTNPDSWLIYGGLPIALIGVSLLIADVILPVPSSLIMITFGAFFGVILGTWLSLVGSLGAGLFAFYLGRRCNPILIRFIPLDERIRVNSFLGEWGALAVVITRPVPILAETVAILAGTSSLSWTQMTVATLFGSLPAAVLYTLTGAFAIELGNSLVAFGLVTLIAGSLWYIGRYLNLQMTNKPQ